VINNVLLAIGGWNDKVYQLKADGSDWEERTDLKLPRLTGGHAALAYNLQ